MWWVRFDVGEVSWSWQDFYVGSGRRGEINLGSVRSRCGTLADDAPEKATLLAGYLDSRPRFHGWPVDDLAGGCKPRAMARAFPGLGLVTPADSRS
jgi:hypothetical protein